MSNPRRVLELDGLRGLAILLVLLGHYCSNILPGISLYGFANFGVNIFFVLSGFLIGGILLDERAQRGFISSFYLRRAARILPIYALVVTACFVIQSIFQERSWIAQDPLLPAWIYATFTTNVAFAISGTQTGLMLGPTWSLAVEEQFYLFAPFLILATTKRSLPVLLTGLCIAAIYFRTLLQGNLPAIEFLLPCRMDALAIGIAAALLQKKANLESYRAQILTISAAAAVLPALLASISQDTGDIVANTLASIAIAGIILAAINGASFGAKLRAQWLCSMGRISYGLYLVHQPVRIVLTGAILDQTIMVPSPVSIVITALSIGVSILIAYTSWALLELPIIQRVKAWNHQHLSSLKVSPAQGK